MAVNYIFGLTFATAAEGIPSVLACVDNMERVFLGSFLHNSGDRKFVNM